MLGTLGNGFPYEKAEGKKVFLMGGGIGVPPILELAKEMNADKQIKAAGGIANLDDAQKFLDLGAHRLGTSRVVKAVKAL